jgi:hypothetical protein
MRTDQGEMAPTSDSLGGHRLECAHLHLFDYCEYSGEGRRLVDSSIEGGDITAAGTLQCTTPQDSLRVRKWERISRFRHQH